MPAWNVSVDEGPAPQLGSFEPGFGESLKAAVGSTFEENVTTLGYDYLKNQSANNGLKMDKAAAEAMVKDAGVKLTIPDSGYTQEALSQLIQRQTDTMTRQSVMDRTPWSWLGSPARGTAMLLTGLTDPLNIASAFIPVVGEARAATMLAKVSGLGRVGTRAAIGAAEGAVGAAVLEPAVYGLHQGLQDDYHMVDSLINLGFGGLLGGGLHAVGGTFADALHVGRDPYARFAGLEQKEVARVLEYEKLVRKGETPNADSWTQAMRQAAGLETPSAASVMNAASPETREATLRTAVVEMVNGRTPDVEAIVHAETPPRVAAPIPEGVEIREVPGGFEAYKDGQKVGYLKDNLERGQAKQIQENANIDIVKVDKEVKGKGIGAALYEAFFQKHEGMVAPSGKTTADAWAVWQRNYPDKVDAFVQQEAARIRDGASPQMVIGNITSPEIAQRVMAEASNPAGKARDVLSTAERQRSPEAAMLGSPEASKAAEVRVAEAPKEHAVEAAKAELTDAMSRLNELQKNLETGGADPAKLSRITEGLRAFDEAIKDAANIGKAIIQNAVCGLRG